MPQPMPSPSPRAIFSAIDLSFTRKPQIGCPNRSPNFRSRSPLFLSSDSPPAKDAAVVTTIAASAFPAAFRRRRLPWFHRRVLSKKLAIAVAFLPSRFRPPPRSRYGAAVATAATSRRLAAAAAFLFPVSSHRSCHCSSPDAAPLQLEPFRQNDESATNCLFHCRQRFQHQLGEFSLSTLLSFPSFPFYAFGS